MLVLDEAAANLDAEAEMELDAAIAAAASRRTVIIVAHRPSTIMRADQVVVLRGGRVVEIGDPHVLVNAGGSLSQLLAFQDPH